MYLIINADGTRQVAVTSPSPLPEGATFLLLPDNYRDSQIQNYQADPEYPGNAVFVVPQPLYAVPNITGFIAAIRNDPLATANNSALSLQMIPLLVLLQQDLGNLTLLQADWAAVCANQAYGVTSTVALMIEKYADQFSIHLVP